MKIIFFMEGYYRGGVVTFLINLINNWPIVSDELVLICNENNPGIGEFEKRIIRPCKVIKHKIITFMYFFNKPHKKNLFDSLIKITLKGFSFILRYIFLVYNIFALRKPLRKVKADRLMVVYGGYPNGDCCRAATIAWGLFVKKPKSILNFHGLVVKAPWRIRLQESIVDIFVSSFTKNIVTVSEACVRSMSVRAFLKKHSISYIYNGLEAKETVGIRDIKAEIGISAENPLCIMMGTYDKNKGHDFLLRAFKSVVAEVPYAHLLICGDGSYEQVRTVRRQVSKFGLDKNVHIMGFRRDVANLLRQANVLLVSSQQFESFGLSSVEAMAQGIPVVATNVGALPEIVINGEGGYCVDKNDISSYASCVIRLLKDKDLSKEQGQLGYRRYKELFTAFRMSSEYTKLIHSG